jgi:predicted nucleic acid-binding protein
MAAYVLREEHWESVETILREAPIAVELLPAEAANAVLMASRTKRVSPSEAEEALSVIQRFCRVGVTLHSLSPLLPDAWKIATEQRLTIYDAAYVALARRERTSLASRDVAQIQGARAVGVRPIEL